MGRMMVIIRFWDHDPISSAGRIVIQQCIVKPETETRELTHMEPIAIAYKYMLYFPPRYEYVTVEFAYVDMSLAELWAHTDHVEPR